ncbi:hypothetical protein RHSIM_Rhsim06G0079400 [Rhododendron simsii]|uniref:EF-hand domain-containing protein n=1 Tax=Rhododendron simsii TaxID=118357 RepID=A0A834LN08_RHOSS|nr:hypothetical protein RHSIM_Rhsim06G0079400 [Rhododendron simsii]
MRYILGNAIQQRSLTSLGDMDEVQKVFNKFDTNGDGKISVSKLRSVFKALGVDAGVSSADLTDAVTEIDKDGDGAIDIEEFTDLHHRRRRGKSNNGKSNHPYHILCFAAGDYNPSWAPQRVKLGEDGGAGDGLQSPVAWITVAGGKRRRANGVISDGESAFYGFIRIGTTTFREAKALNNFPRYDFSHPLPCLLL